VTGHKLVLLAADPEFVPADPEALLEALCDAGLCAARLPAEGQGAPTRYRVGGEFLGLISFLGCSPKVRLEPEGPHDRSFCHLEVSGPFERVEFLGGGALKPPRCPGCRSLVADWRERLLRWERDRSSSAWSCPKCGRSSDLYRLDWRRSAGFGRFALDIWNIYDGEAVPSDALLELLKEATGVRWDYFYA
jgi:hypothetical protein